MHEKTISPSVKYLTYDPNVIENHEIIQLSKAFPNVGSLSIAAENVLEHKIDFRGFKKLKEIEFIVLASDDFTGEIDDEAE